MKLSFICNARNSVILRYTYNIVQLDSFYIKFDSIPFFYQYNKDKPCNDQEGQAVSQWRTNHAMIKKDKPSVGEGQTMQWPRRTSRQSVKDKPCNDQGQAVTRWRTNHAMTKKDKPSVAEGQTMQWPRRTNRQSVKDKQCNDQEGQTVSRWRTNNAMIKKVTKRQTMVDKILHNDRL